MITIIIVAAIGILVGYFGEDDSIRPSGEKIGHAFGGMIIATLFGILFAFLVGSFYPDHPTVRKVVHLHNLNDVGGAHGDFFLGCGMMRDNMTYYYYEEVDGKLYPQTLGVDGRVSVVEDQPAGNAELRVSYSQPENYNPMFGILMVNAVGYEFHVPKNTVYHGYALGKPER